MGLWLQDFTEDDRAKIRYIQGRFRGRYARKQMVAFRAVVGRARAATVIQKHVRGLHARKQIKGARNKRDFAWDAYHNMPSATVDMWRSSRLALSRSSH
jgi:hypothetical protein